VSSINKTNDHIVLYGKHGGWPVWTEGVIVDNTYDATGDDSSDTNTTISNSYPKAELYWFLVVNNGTNQVTFDIIANLGAPVTVDQLNPYALQFNDSVTNNTLNFPSASGNQSELQYFTYTANQITIGIASKDADSAPNVYVDIAVIPSPDSNLFSNINDSESVHLVFADSTPTAAKWYVYSVSSSLVDTQWVLAINRTNDFVIWSGANGACSVNCSGNGVCDETTGVCDCEDGYEKYDCSDKVFPLVWIILIAIGGAILLAIAIGVPVSCYVKNRKKSGYERV